MDEIRDPIYGPGTNSGHGHIWQRPDGIVARCGGPALCMECETDRRWFQEQTDKWLAALKYRNDRMIREWNGDADEVAEAPA
jgi:hypothetical protein